MDHFWAGVDAYWRAFKPSLRHGEAMSIRWRYGREPRALVTGTDANRFARLARLALGRWGAFRTSVRGARWPSPDEVERLFASTAKELEALSSVDASRFSWNDHGRPLVSLFEALAQLEPASHSKWVITSKAGYLLLPDLIVPMDNRFTRPLVGRWPPDINKDFLREFYEGVGNIARRRRGILMRLQKEVQAKDPELPPIGLARVIDFGIIGSRA